MKNTDKLKSLLPLDQIEQGALDQIFDNLTRFPIDYLKIDRSFVANLNKKKDDEVIVNTIFSMARALGLKVVAEGVETWEQLQTLEKMGPCLIQGFLFSEAVSASELEVFIADNAAMNVITQSKLRSTA